jgi:type I restriction enzyme S subunit
MKMVANYGARHDRMAISTKDFMDMPLPEMHPEEQKKIANFLSAIDEKITHATKQLDHAKTFKKGLLQKMFV